MTPGELAEELGHDDEGYVIRRFLHDPDDGGGDFEAHPRWGRWHLTHEQADRVRHRFT